MTAEEKVLAVFAEMVRAKEVNEPVINALNVTLVSAISAADTLSAYDRVCFIRALSRGIDILNDEVYAMVLKAAKDDFVYRKEEETP